MLRVGVALLIVALACPVGILLLEDQWAIGGAMIVGTFTIGASLLIGAPLVAWCIRRGWLAPWQAVLGGSLAGLLCSGVLFLGGLDQGPLPFVLFGAAHGFAFWVLAFWRNSRIRRNSAPDASSQVSTTGVVMSTYVPSGDIQPGSFATVEPSEKELDRRKKMGNEMQ